MIRPLTLLIPGLYAYGLVLLRRMRDAPMWQPTHTSATSDEDEDDGAGSDASTGRLWDELAALGLVVGVAG